MPVRLLLLEDNPGDAVIFREKIAASALDVTVVHAKRLSEALAHLDGAAFDLLLVDLSLPDSQGLESVERVRKAAPHLPVIVLTGLDDAATAAEAKKRGAVDYLVKWYVDGPSLARYIRYAIEQYRLLGDRGPLAPETAPETTSETVPAEVPRGASPGIAAPPEVRPTEARPTEAPPAVDVERPAVEAPRAVSVAPAPAAPIEEATGAQPALPDTATLVAAVEAGLAMAAQTAALAGHLAGSLRAALDLARAGAAGTTPRRETIDALALAQQAADRARARALHQGFPLRVRADRKKVMAAADGRLLCDTLDRLFTLALATGCADGVQVTVASEGGRTAIRAAWEFRRGVDLAEPDDPLVALDLALCRRLAARAGGAFSLTTADADAEAVLLLDAPSHA